MAVWQQNKSPSGRSLDNTNVLSPVLGLQCVTADREGGDDLLCVSAGRVRWPNSDTVASLLQLTRGSQPKAVLQSQTQFKLKAFENEHKLNLDSFSISDDTRTLNTKLLC